MAKAVKKPRKKATNGYKMPEPLPQGEILTDMTNKQWKLGPFVGKGGFGEIYSAQEVSTKSSKKYPYVIKVEPHENGPLFVEMHFYMKSAKPADIDTFKKKHKLKTFGMPAYLGSGSHQLGPNKYRFIVMERFGIDIDKMREENGGTFPAAVVFQLAWQMAFVLEYIHEFGYVHADIKGANMLLGMTPETKNQAYLVDFGLATKFFTEKEFKINPKKAHDGTIEYLSRDAHQGVPTRRGDLEILGYNIIHWLGGELPWDKKLNDKKKVQQGKEQAMSDIPNFVNTCFKSVKTNSADTIVHFLKYVNSLKFNEEPNYKKVRDLFKKEIEKNGSKVDGSLDLHPRNKRQFEDDEVVTPKKKTKENSDDEGTPKKVLRKRSPRKKKGENKDDNEILTEINTADQKPTKEVKKVVKKGRTTRKKNVEVEEKNEDNIEEVMTSAMKEILAKRLKKNVVRKKRTVKE